MAEENGLSVEDRVARLEQVVGTLVSWLHMPGVFGRSEVRVLLDLLRLDKAAPAEIADRGKDAKR